MLKRCASSNLVYLAVSNLRILSPSNHLIGISANPMDLFADAYPALYQTLYEAKPITCSVMSTTFDAVSAPCAVILDVSLPILRLTIITVHDCSFLFELPVLCPSSIASY